MSSCVICGDSNSDPQPGDLTTIPTFVRLLNAHAKKTRKRKTWKRGHFPLDPLAASSFCQACWATVREVVVLNSLVEKSLAAIFIKLKLIKEQLEKRNGPSPSPQKTNGNEDRLPHHVDNLQRLETPENCELLDVDEIKMEIDTEGMDEGEHFVVQDHDQEFQDDDDHFGFDNDLDLDHEEEDPLDLGPETHDSNHQRRKQTLNQRSFTTFQPKIETKDKTLRSKSSRKTRPRKKPTRRPLPPGIPATPPTKIRLKSATKMYGNNRENQTNQNQNDSHSQYQYQVQLLPKNLKSSPENAPTLSTLLPAYRQKPGSPKRRQLGGNGHVEVNEMRLELTDLRDLLNFNFNDHLHLEGCRFKVTQVPVTEINSISKSQKSATTPLELGERRCKKVRFNFFTDDYDNEEDDEEDNLIGNNDEEYVQEEEDAEFVEDQDFKPLIPPRKRAKKSKHLKNAHSSRKRLIKRSFKRLNRKGEKPLPKDYRHCPICGATSEKMPISKVNSHLLKEHPEFFPQQDDKGLSPYKRLKKECPTCGKPYTAFPIITRHMWSHLSEEEREQRLQNGEQDPRVEVREQSRERRAQGYICKYCGKFYRDQGARNSHEYLHADPNDPNRLRPKYACPEEGCGRVFLHKKGLHYHQARLHDKDVLFGKLFSCTIPHCEEKYTDRRQLNNHLKLVHHVIVQGGRLSKKIGVRVPPRALQCTFCPPSTEAKDWYSKERLLKHMGLCHPGEVDPRLQGNDDPNDPNEDDPNDFAPKPPKKMPKGSGDCHICGKPFATTSAFYLKIHLWSHLSKEEAEAKIAGGSRDLREFNTRFIRHKRVTQICELCGLTLSSERALINHMFNKHSDNRKTIPCPSEGCGKVFKSKTGLIYHEVKVHGADKVRWHHCPHCHLKFHVKHHLDSHLVSHLPPGERPFKCKVSGCGEGFRRREQLNKHVKDKHKD